ELAHVCQWDEIEVLSRRLIALVESDPPLPGEPAAPFAFVTLPVETSSRQQFRCAKRWCDVHLRQTVDLAAERRGNVAPAANAKLTIGYLSADFHAHATALLVAELLERHDRERFKIVAYSYGPDDKSAMRARLIGGVDRFVDVRGAAHAAAA